MPIIWSYNHESGVKYQAIKFCTFSILWHYRNMICVCRTKLTVVTELTVLTVDLKKYDLLTD